MESNGSPWVGKIVLYTNLGDSNNEFPPEQQAAIVTKVHDNATVSLKILYATGIFDMQDVKYSEKFKRRHWSNFPVYGEGYKFA